MFILFGFVFRLLYTLLNSFPSDGNKISRRRWKQACTWCFILKVSISRNVTFCVITRYNVPLVISYHMQLYTRVRKLLNFDEFFTNFLFYRYVFEIFDRSKELSALNRGRSEVLFLYLFFSNYFPRAILSMTKARGHLWQTWYPRNMVINYLSLVTTEKHFTQSGWSGLEVIAVLWAIIAKRDSVVSISHTGSRKINLTLFIIRNIDRSRTSVWLVSQRRSNLVKSQLWYCL